MRRSLSLLAVLATASCSVLVDTAGRCSVDDECRPGRVCVGGRCRDGVGGGGGVGGGSGGGSGGADGGPADGGRPDAGTGDAGAGDGGPVDDGCSFETCPDGCCRDGGCVTQGATACGRGGQACLDCAAGNTFGTCLVDAGVCQCRQGANGKALICLPGEACLGSDCSCQVAAGSCACGDGARVCGSGSGSFCGAPLGNPCGLSASCCSLSCAGTTGSAACACAGRGQPCSATTDCCAPGATGLRCVAGQCCVKKGGPCSPAAPADCCSGACLPGGAADAGRCG